MCGLGWLFCLGFVLWWFCCCVWLGFLWFWLIIVDSLVFVRGWSWVWFVVVDSWGWCFLRFVGCCGYGRLIVSRRFCYVCLVCWKFCWWVGFCCCCCGLGSCLGLVICVLCCLVEWIGLGWIVCWFCCVCYCWKSFCSGCVGVVWKWSNWCCVIGCCSWWRSWLFVCCCFSSVVRSCLGIGCCCCLVVGWCWCWDGCVSVRMILVVCFVLFGFVWRLCCVGWDSYWWSNDRWVVKSWCWCLVGFCCRWDGSWSC